MEFRQYVLSLICCALIGTILPYFSGESEKRIMKLICGLFMTVSILSLFLKVDVEKIMEYTVPHLEYDAPAHEGEKMANESVCQIIKTETEAYILDKAIGAGLEITVDVIMGDEQPPLPVGVRIKGNISPENRKWLSQMLFEEIGIPEEAHRWID